jgi:ribosomal protein L37AE/L43A
MAKFNKSAHFCRTPVFTGKVAGKIWVCGVCGARFKYVVSERVDRQGRPSKKGSWLMQSNGRDV